MKVFSEESGGCLKLSFVGELDHHGAQSAMKTIENLIDEYMPREVIMDLSELNFMDSSGIAIILRVNRRMRDVCGNAWVENPVGQPLRILDAAGIDRFVKVYERKE